MKESVLITGGGSGIGKEVAKLFYKEYYKVIILGRDEEKLKLLKEELNNDIEYFVGDVSNSDKMKEIINKINNISILVNCAGIISEVEEPLVFDNNILNNTIDINLKGTIILSSLVIEKMIKTKIKGNIINISSIAAHNGSKYFPIYSASKGAIISYTKSIASRYGEYGIRCNLISPGVIKTPMSYIETPDFDSYINELNLSHPVGRIGKPIDIANMVLYLSSDKASFITGQEFIIDGGYTLSKE